MPIIENVMKRSHRQVLVALVLLITGSLMVCTAGAGDPDLRVMSFNIRNGNANDGANHWDLRKEFVYEVIRDAAPDVLGLQEAVRFQLDLLNEHFPEYAELGIVSDRTRHTGQYSAILYRKDRFELHASGNFWLSDTPETPSANWGNHHLRICTWVRLVEKETARSFYVYNTHMDDGSQRSREKGIELIMRHFHGHTDPAPLVLMGDLNVGEDNPVISYLTGTGSLEGGATPVVMADTFRVLHPDEAAAGTFNGFKGGTKGRKIDYILVCPKFETLEAAIVRTSRDGRYPSDHFPVTAKLRFAKKTIVRDGK